MAARMMLIVAGIAILGLVLALAGAYTDKNASFITTRTVPGLTITDNWGTVLIALGLTLLLVGVGFILAWSGEKEAGPGML